MGSHYAIREVVESGSIPKFIMYLLHIDSIEGVTDISSTSKEVQVQNAEACVRYLKQNNPTFTFLLFDFRTPSTVSYSVRSLILNVINLYFLKSTKEEMIERYNLLFGENLKFDNKTTLFQCDIDLHVKLAYFIVTGRSDCRPFQIKDGNDYCWEHKLPFILDFTEKYYYIKSEFETVFFYQMQIFYDCIDNGRKSLLITHLIPLLTARFKSLMISIL